MISLKKSNAQSELSSESEERMGWFWARIYWSVLRTTRKPYLRGGGERSEGGLMGVWGFAVGGGPRRGFFLRGFSCAAAEMLAAAVRLPADARWKLGGKDGWINAS